MWKSLFKEDGQFYKANLHGHTTVSDGVSTPEEVKAIYKEKGYAILAYTDHDVLVSQSHLCDPDFLALTSCEYEFNDPACEHLPYSFMRTYHFCLYSPVPYPQEYPYPNPDCAWGNARKYAEDQPWYFGKCPHTFKVKYVNEMIDAAHALGFLVSYNHPDWSLNSWPDYEGIRNIDFVECGNSGCYVEGYTNDYSDLVYRDFLRRGERCFPTATDDGHHPDHYCMAWNMIRAKSLSYEDVFAAMREGDLYASWGPEIRNLRFDPDSMRFHVECSPVKYIFLNTERRYNGVRRSSEDRLLTSADFDLGDYFRETYAYGNPKRAYVRIVLIDAEGRKAVSRGYFADELMGPA